MPASPLPAPLPLFAQADVPSLGPGMFGDLGLGLRLAIGAAVLVVGFVAARLARRVLEPRLARLRTPSFGSVFARLTGFGIGLVSALFALVVVFPSVNVGTLVGGLGVFGIAAGFAFQDILSNLLSGILLIFRQPFVSGDQITVADVSGTVEEITIRETRIRGYDGRLYVVPNIDVYTGLIEVQTNRATVRTSLVVGVGYDTDLAEAQRLALEVLDGIDGVLADPAPQAYWTELGASSVNLDLRYWTDPHQAQIRRVQSDVVAAIFDAYNDADIDMPFDVVTLDASDSVTESLAQALARRDERT